MLQTRTPWLPTKLKKYASWKTFHVYQLALYALQCCGSAHLCMPCIGSVPYSCTTSYVCHGLDLCAFVSTDYAQFIVQLKDKAHWNDDNTH